VTKERKVTAREGKFLCGCSEIYKSSCAFFLQMTLEYKVTMVNKMPVVSKAVFKIYVITFGYKKIGYIKQSVAFNILKLA
jgi:hypothetical protein